MNKFILIIGLMVSFCAASSQQSIHIPTDSKASYTVLEKGNLGGLRTIVTKRDGSSGTSYSQRAYDCSNGQVKYLGTGDSLAEMKASKPDPNLSPIIEQSIAYYVGKEACK
ncbi:hypothetical protein M979_0335 [Buttiauxella noackiae ATCC 51607]|uniref:Uncharacterized protein n=1 Tax=Buttiauxella noackiae ATCC 51607 TaxID=1354255 RepID=A0A1B7HZG8_9ENTR|nr:hypothetical protein [Buttiauxella noackiae]OAT21106.1 hypothetical protein M979_0335 [Buttiauxella noackiae ATCC 51607]